MATPEDEPRIITTDTAEARVIFDSLYLLGALDEGDIYEIAKLDGTTERLQLEGSLRHIADNIIQAAYPGCVATLLSSGESTKA